jgi:hypothetical protein
MAVSVMDVDDGEETWRSEAESDESAVRTLGGAGACFFGFSFGLDELPLDNRILKMLFQF